MSATVIGQTKDVQYCISKVSVAPANLMRDLRLSPPSPRPFPMTHSHSLVMTTLLLLSRSRKKHIMTLHRKKR